MPIKNLESIAKKYDVSTKTAEKKWKEAEKIVKKEYDPDEESGKYYGTIIKILNAKLKKVKNEAYEDLAPLAAKVSQLQKIAAAKAIKDAGKAATGILTPARRAAKEKAKLAMAVAKRIISQPKTDTEIIKIAGMPGIESKTIDTPVVEDGEVASQGSINTGSMNGSITDQSGNSIPSVTGFSAAYFPSYWGAMQKRSQKKKKRKRVKEAIDYVENYLNKSTRS